ncbi:MAG: ferredoxin [Spirochaetaceae bacterium]|nr:ferredoxin [Spirochaetaceae bacterium]
MLVNEDISVEKETLNDTLVVDKKACMDCSFCSKTYPSLFDMYEGKVKLKNMNFENVEKIKLQIVIDKCPSQAISVE